MAFSWVALLAFVRLTTKAGLFPRPLSPDQAMDRVDAWLAAPPAVVVEPTADDNDSSRFPKVRWETPTRAG